MRSTCINYPVQIVLTEQLLIATRFTSIQQIKERCPLLVTPRFEYCRSPSGRLTKCLSSINFRCTTTSTSFGTIILPIWISNELKTIFSILSNMFAFRTLFCFIPYFSSRTLASCVDLNRKAHRHSTSLLLSWHSSNTFLLAYQWVCHVHAWQWFSTKNIRTDRSIFCIVQTHQELMEFFFLAYLVKYKREIALASSTSTSW